MTRSIAAMAVTNAPRRRLALDRIRQEPTQLLWLGLSALGLAFLIATILPPNGYDAYAYWVVDPRDPYAGVGVDLEGKDQGAFRYAPVMALPPFELLPWPVFRYGWMTLQLVALWYVGRRWALALLLFTPVWLDLVYGNINILLAATVVAGFRHPWVWSFALLTKVTPGIGVLWFAVRREWRNLGLVVGAVVVLGVVSVPFVGIDLWRDWVLVLNSSAGMQSPGGTLPIPVLPRLVLAAIVVTWGALTDRKWTVAVAVTIAMPTLWPIAFAPLVGVVPFVRKRTPSHAA